MFPRCQGLADELWLCEDGETGSLSIVLAFLSTLVAYCRTNARYNNGRNVRPTQQIIVSLPWTCVFRV